MKALKGILIALVVTLIVILGVGGALIGFNHDGHETDSKTAQGNVGHGNQKQPDNKQGDAGKDNNQQSQNQQSESKQVIVATEQVAPEEYFKRIKEAQDLINEGTSLITNKAYEVAGNSQDSENQNANVQGMDKMHQGIYKLAQGNILMNQALEGMEQEIKKAREANGSFYQIPSNAPLNYYYNPYSGWSYPYQNQMIQPNLNSQNQADPNIHNNTNTQNNDSVHNNNAGHSVGLSGLFSSQNIILLVYGFLFLSLIGIFVAIVGYLNSFLKPSKEQQ